MSRRRVLRLCLVAALAACPPLVATAALPTTLSNPGFDTASGPLPSGWVLDQQVKDKGTIRLLEHYPDAEGKVMELRPNSRNSGDRLLGVGQMLDAGPFRGQRLTVRAILAASDGASAVVGVHALGKGGDLGFIQITQGDSNGTLKPQQKTLEIPSAAENLIVYAIATGGSGKAFFDSVSLVVNAAMQVKGAPDANAGKAGGAELIVDAGRGIRTIPQTLYGTNVEWIFDGQGLWSAKNSGLDPTAIRLTRELGTTLIRFPGGVFSDSYHWRNGLGSQDKRATTEHHPKGPKSRHSFGLPELTEFASAVGAELLLTVNAGTGSPEEAADWVRHMNQSTGSKTRYWEVGNELYMKGDLSGAHLSADSYSSKFEKFAVAMRGVDPSIRLGAIGGLNYGNYRFIADDKWTEILLRRNAGQIDFLAIHNAYAPVVMGPVSAVDPRAVYAALLAAPMQIERNLQDVSRLVAKHEKPGRPIFLAITEWGPFFHVLPESPWVDHVKTMGSALFVGATMNAFLRTPRVEIANFFKLTDHGFMGWLGRRKGELAATAPAMVFSLYRRNLGRNLVEVRATGPTFSSREIGVVSGADRVPYLDAVATSDNDVLTLIVVNRSEDQSIETNIVLKGTAAYGAVKVQTIHAKSLDSHTGTELPAIPGLRWAPQVSVARFANGAPGEIQFATENLPGTTGTGMDKSLTYLFRPLSVTCLTFSKVRRDGK